MLVEQPVQSRREQTTVRVSLMAIAAVAALAVAEVTRKTTKTKMAVRTVSKMKAPPTPIWISDLLA